MDGPTEPGSGQVGLPGGSSAAASEVRSPMAAEQGAPMEHGEVEDFSQEPLAERLTSKDLARRCSGYAEAQASMADGEVCRVFAASAEQSLQEALPKGQDAGLNAAAAYLQHCPGIADKPKELLPWVRKLADHKAVDKPKIQQLAPVIILLIAEIVDPWLWVSISHP
ncbi:unnamed protein product [Effrenium voratum]|nr:unnamed protein product [Effrenium voratum]